jgi:hypothetical protein
VGKEMDYRLLHGVWICGNSSIHSWAALVFQSRKGGAQRGKGARLSKDFAGF